MGKYGEELQNSSKNEGVIGTLEKRFSWTIRVVSALMNLGYAPKVPKLCDNENNIGEDTKQEDHGPNE